MSTPTPAQPGAAPKPMATALLAELRAAIEAEKCGVSWGLAITLQELLADRDHHAGEAERRKDAEQVWAATVERLSEELAETCDKVDALTAELERLVSDINRRGAECARLACAHADAGLTVDVGRCIGERDAYVRAAGLLASALRVSPRASEPDKCKAEGCTRGHVACPPFRREQGQSGDFAWVAGHWEDCRGCNGSGLASVADFERGEP